jgi:hypothetical protein
VIITTFVFVSFQVIEEHKGLHRKAGKERKGGIKWCRGDHPRSAGMVSFEDVV